MATYADFAFYTDQFKGTAIAESDFDRLAMRASEELDQITFDRIAAVIEADEDGATIEKIQRATCAAAEELQKLESSGGAVSTETVGKQSVTYAAPLSEAQRLTRCAKRYLGLTGLMYAGVE